jgi:acetoin:2,6-dichlorophenolindophenol oxidoreductase subunit beta
MAIKSYAQAIREASAQLLETDPRVMIFGQGLWSPWYVGSSMTDLDKTFGRERVLDSPVSENATTAAGVGAALVGMRPIIIHPRMDFMVLAMDPLINQAANWSYMFGGQRSVPLTVRAIINRGGEQGAQHSQALQAHFAHIPGLKVVMPATASDAKGLLVAAVRDLNPVIYIEDRWLYGVEDEVDDRLYEVPIGEAQIRRHGEDITIVAVSYMNEVVKKALPHLIADGISVEHIDLVSVKPWDRECILQSVRKTGRLIVADTGWLTCGVASEIAATLAETAFASLKAPIRRFTLPDLPAPTSRVLEAAYYPTSEQLVELVGEVISYRLSPGAVPRARTDGDLKTSATTVARRGRNIKN